MNRDYDFTEETAAETEVRTVDVAEVEERLRPSSGNDTPFGAEYNGEVSVESSEYEGTRIVRVVHENDGDTPADGEQSGERAVPTNEEGDDESLAARGRRQMSLLYQIAMGTILNSNFIRDNFRYWFILALMLLVSIVMLFTSLGVYTRYTKLDEEVQVLRNRAAELNRECFEESSHTSVSRRLEERGIDLRDPRTPWTIIE